MNSPVERRVLVARRDAVTELGHLSTEIVLGHLAPHTCTVEIIKTETWLAHL